MLRWLRRCEDARRLAKADAEALSIRDHGAEAYGEARRREHDVVLPDGPAPGGGPLDDQTAGATGTAGAFLGPELAFRVSGCPHRNSRGGTHAGTR